METTTLVRSEFAEPKSISTVKSPDESANVKKFPEFIAQLQSLVTEAQTLWLNAETERRDASNENKILRNKIHQLRNLVNNLKNKPCSKCSRLLNDIQEYKKQMKKKDELLVVLVNNGVTKDHHSYNVYSQMVNNTIGEFNATELMNTDDPMLESENTVLAKSPDKVKRSEITPEDEKKPDTEVSPIVLKRSRNSKRRIMCISSKKKNKTEDGDCASDSDLDLNFPQLKVVNITDGVSACSTRDHTNVMNCITALDQVDQSEKTLLEQSPEVLNETIDHYSLSKKNNYEEQSPEVLNRSIEVRRSLSYEPNLPKLNGNAAKCTFTSSDKSAEVKNCNFNFEECKQRTVEKPLNSLNVNVINNVNGAPSYKFENETLKSENSNQKTKWELKKSREPTNNKKLKQTVLSTVVFEKKLDISTLSEYNGGLMPSEVKQPTVEKHDGKNNETFFDPLVTSTSNDHLTQKTPVKNQDLVDNSFDVIPNTSPNYKYRRDAVRKKAERRKLPGQDCTKCFNFYNQQRNILGETQTNKLLNKCSRHRDKFAIQANTPPGLWNPNFDTDEETDK